MFLFTVPIFAVIILMLPVTIRDGDKASNTSMKIFYIRLTRRLQLLFFSMFSYVRSVTAVK